MKKENCHKYIYGGCALLILIFLVRIGRAYGTYRMYAIPFYYHVIGNGILFLLPCAALLIVAGVLRKRYHGHD